MAIPEKVLQWKPIIEKWARQIPLDPELVMAIIQMESGGNPNATRYEPAFEKAYISGNSTWVNRMKEMQINASEVATSYGLMQLMFSTAYGYGCKSIQQALDPDQNIRFGMAHLKQLIDKNGIEKGIAKYNGEGDAADRYARNVMALYKRYLEERGK